MSLADDIAQITMQEARLRFEKFDEADAWALGVQLHTHALAKNLAMVMEIRIGNRELFYAALPGTSSENRDFARRKANTVMRFLKSSYRINLEYENHGLDFGLGRGINVMEHAREGGGFPIHVIGTGVVGSIAVSGIPQREDHGFIVENLCIFLGLPHQELALGAQF
jgi:uncharacterized protein (UPF0303 family)